MNRSMQAHNCHSDRTIKEIDSLSLAMAYVPWQQWEEIYSPEEALKQGTIFKKLDLPFVGRRCDRL